MNNNFHTEVLVIGSGVSGLLTAELLAAEKNVTVITKSELGKSNSRLAQGGIAAVTSDDDSWADHFFDTIQAGVFHNNNELTELLVKKGGECVSQLIEMGVTFDQSKDGTYSRCREGAHSVPRILHAGGDATGKELMNKLVKRVKESSTIIEHHAAVDLIVENGFCAGASFMNEKGNLLMVKADFVILATGGAGQLYPVTSNDTSVTGDGIAMAYRAGAIVSDLEFMQFHPTMYAGSGASFLLSEAVRGEGGRLVMESGVYLMEGKHELLDLAPRDVVARAIYEEQNMVYLDISAVTNFDDRFPTIASYLNEDDASSKKVPVQPGAHFLMGGVETDRYGRTSVANLFAIGEVANTGVHGANRLASNSLLEAVVFANEAATWMLNHKRVQHGMAAASQPLHIPNSLPDPSKLRTIMNDYVGITRHAVGLSTAIDELGAYLKGKKKLASSVEEVTLTNMLQTSWLMATSAYMRTESRGGHHRSDFPQANQRFQQKRIKRRILEDEWATTEKKSRAVF
ncbi:L-aspartate oxidase [Guptibacillus algicola]|uniref:L-aspartate oxidase n=1 Tax=Guptibacillus algicola TaxID=225844 RepID=UPI001CD55CD9|nr:L-aspartate oxidase [Alkalihalobacillus algicola]MCA0986987.1 L-aspartate oxidase [Alkalihalobacillus algicola]